MLLWWALLVALAGGGAWGLIRLRRIVAVGAAYKAKVLCSIVFGTGRTVDPNRAPEVAADSYFLMRLFRVRIDPDRRRVTASFFGRSPRSATFRPGLGATLMPTGEADVLLDASGLADCHQASRVLPPGFGDTPTNLNRLLDVAFSEPNPRRLRRTRAIIVMRNGHLVAERYAPGFDSDVRFPGWSMTKSVLSALVGTLVGEGRISLDDRALLPGWQPPDPRANITVEDLLRMRSGLRFSEVYSDLSSDVIEMLFNRSDTAHYAARQPLVASPGTTWSYASGTTNILSAIARRLVGDPDYLGWPRRALFDPIGMTSAILEPDASGTFVGSSFMFANARDWARFGQLYLDDGVCDGQRILPDGWVQFSTSPTPQSDGAYGAHWWLKLQPEMGGGTPAAARIPADTFFALGHEGQTLTVIPSLQLVVVRLGLAIYVDAWNHAAFVADLVHALTGRE